MFDFRHPPFLVIAVAERHANEFAERSGYIRHPLTEGKVLLSHGDGWTFHIPARKKSIITEPPMMLVKNAGGVTSESSRARSGYAHQFVNEDGSEPECLYKRNLFPDEPDAEWMLIADSIDAIWLQFTAQNQYLGDVGSDMILYQYGKLIILNLSIVKDIAPSMDRKADITEMHDMQYRVRERQIFSISWNMTDRDTSQYLAEQLSERALDRYDSAVEIALARAGYTG